MITAEALMAGAMTKYITLHDGKQWVKEDENKHNIIALVATLKNAGTSLTSKKKQPQKEEEKKNRPKDDIKPKAATGEYVSNIPGWKLISPAKGKSSMMERDSKTYYWCPNHHDKGMWVIHKASDCKVNKPAAHKKGVQPSPNRNDDKKKIKPSDDLSKALLAATGSNKSFLAQAYAAAMADDSEEDSK